MRRFTVLCCLLAFWYCQASFVCVPPLFAAGKQATVTHRLRKDTGWNVCRDLVKNLNKLQQSDSSYRCEMRFHPDIPQFAEPEWEELDIADHLQEVFEIERDWVCSWFPQIGEQSLAEWQESYLKAMQEGSVWRKWGPYESRRAFRPRLRMARVHIDQDGPPVTILAYSLLADYGERCKEQKSKCPSPSLEEWENVAVRENHMKCLESLPGHRDGEWGGAQGDYLFDYDPHTRKIHSIGTAERSLGSGAPRRLFLYNHRAYTSSLYAYDPDRWISRMKREELSPGVYMYHFQYICVVQRISSIYP